MEREKKKEEREGGKVFIFLLYKGGNIPDYRNI